MITMMIRMIRMVVIVIFPNPRTCFLKGRCPIDGKSSSSSSSSLTWCSVGKWWCSCTTRMDIHRDSSATVVVVQVLGTDAIGVVVVVVRTVVGSGSIDCSGRCHCHRKDGW